MAALDSLWFSGLLWAMAVAGWIWIIGPAIGFLIYPRKLEVDVDEDPRAAEPHGDDAAYDAKFHQFAALGFVPVGKTVEHTRFLTPLHWHWRSDGSRILALPDRTTFACFHRIADAKRLHVTLVTIFKGGGGVLETASPGVGLDGDNGDDRRIEVAYTDAAGIVEHHQRHVRNFSEERSLIVEPMALREVAARSVASDQRNLRRSQTAAWYLWFVVCAGMAIPIIRETGLPAAPAWVSPAVLCLGALMFAACRRAGLPGGAYRPVPGVIVLALLLLPPCLWWGLPTWMTAEGREVAGLLDRIQADARAGRPLEGVDRIVARGAGVCGEVVTRIAVTVEGSYERRALHEVLVALKGSDLGEEPSAWRRWCLSERLGGH